MQAYLIFFLFGVLGGILDLGPVCFPEESERGKRGREERLKRGRGSFPLLLLMFDWRRKEEGEKPLRPTLSGINR